MASENGVSSGFDRPSERTPLLPSRRPTQEARRDSDTNEPVAPHVGTFAADIKLEDLATYDISDLYPSALSSRPARTAFALCVLLHYRKSIAGVTASRRRDVWSQWHEKTQHTAGIHNLDSLALRVWSEYLEDAGTADEIAEVLWTAYPIDVYSARTVRVIDFLAAGHAPDDLTSHSLVHLSLMDTWKYGRRSTREGDGVVSSLLRFIDRCGTPRVLYIMNVATHLAYLWVLYVFVNRPGYLGRIRHAFVLLYALGKVAQPWSLSTIASLLVLIPFLSWFPGTPQFGSQALANVLLALYLDFIYLHLPVQPNSPLFLLRPDRVLPLAVLAWRSLRALFIPPLFFLPGLILSLLLLSQTLQRWLLWTWSFASLVGGPTDTQITFMYLLLTMFLLLCISLIYAMIVNPFLAASQGPESSPWDRYTRSVGMEAQRAFIHTVRLYGTENHIPAPLNLLQVVFVRIPQFTLERLRKKDAAARIAAFDKVLWRITVGPAAFLLSALWLWHLRAY